MSSKVLDMNFAENPISKQSNSPVYSILQHEEREVSYLPVSPNLLNFADKALNQKYIQTLYTCKDEISKPSAEFKSNLLMFYLFLSIYIVILITTALLLHSEGNLSDIQLVFHLICLGGITLVSYIWLICIYKKQWFLMKNRVFFLMLGLAFLSYLIVGDHRVLSEITDSNHTSSRLPTSIGIVCFLVLMRLVLFECFYYLVILATYALILFLGLEVGYSRLSTYSTLSEFSLIALFFVLQILDSQKIDFRTRQLFWRKEKEEEGIEHDLKVDENTNKPDIKSETEILISSCDKIKQELKYAYHVIIFKDVKKRLKQTMGLIEKVKRRIAHGSFFDDVKIETHMNIDEQDKAFIRENYMNVTIESTRDRNNERKVTMSDITEKETDFPFHSYGVAELESVLFSVGKNWNFDIWFVYNTTGHSIFIIAKYFFKKWNLIEAFNIPEDVCDKYFQTLEKGYNHNPYHNACHAADVLHTLLFFYFNGEFLRNLSPLDTISSLVASLGHDVGHPGLTNRFLVNNRDEIAIQYNDISVLENMHCFKIFSIMGKTGCNIFEKLSSDDWVKSRKLIIEMVLETDMSRHFEILGRFRTRALSLSDLNLDNQDDKTLILAMGLKCADIGHSAKIKELHEKWTDLVCEEFYKQGDIERSRRQPISMYCDRENADIPKSQAGFLKNICIPLFDVWCQFLRSDTITRSCLDQMKANYNHWEDKGKARRSTVGYSSAVSKSFEVEKRQILGTSDIAIKRKQSDASNS
ncbi:CHK1_6 [Blepharisma stoltei]|uniref:Phosphodiesterase n=1 Tax=Blepharisma stoltei TaxID=1481888 RepID=A0AAU9JZZ7_9CILI|nr:unnamed protein product [Blepharisma stoltei]